MTIFINEKFCCSVAQSCLTLCDPMDCRTPDFPILYCLPEFSQSHIQSVMPSNHLILYYPLLLLSTVSPRSESFPQSLPDQSLFHWISSSYRWPKYQSFSFSISPSSEYSGLISFRIDWFVSLMSKGLLRIFSNITVWKHQSFGIQPSLRSNSHTRTWLLGKPQLWLHQTLSAKQCLCFLMCCLGLSQLFFQGARVFLLHGCGHHLQWFWNSRK